MSLERQDSRGAMRGSRFNRWKWTIVGLALAPVAAGAWALTFDPSGGPDLSWFCFPLFRLVLTLWEPLNRPFPALLLYLGALGHWPLIGMVVDLLRYRKLPAQACVACGYDLSGLAADAVCPECGAKGR